MKRLYYIATLAIALFASLPIQAGTLLSEQDRIRYALAQANGNCTPKQAVAPVKKRRKRTACPN